MDLKDLKDRKYISRTGGVRELSPGRTMVDAGVYGEKYTSVDRKLINNSKDLPGFLSGLIPDSLKFSAPEIDFGNVGNTQTQSLSLLIASDPAMKTKWDAMNGVGENLAFPAQIPTKKNVFKNIANGIANNAQNAIGVLNAANTIAGMSTPTVSVDELMSTAQSNATTQNVGGVTYERLGEVNDAAAQVDTTAGALGGAASGAAAGAAFGPWGAAIGGVLGGIGGFFSSSSKKREHERRIRAAKLRTLAINADRYSDAQAQYLLNRALEEYGDQSRQQLFLFDEGKPSGVRLGERVLNKNMEIFTPFGKAYGKPNVRLNAGEEVLLKDGTSFGIPNISKYKGDKAYSYISPDDLEGAFIASNKPEMSLDGISPADKVRYAKMTGELPYVIDDIENELSMANMIRKSNKRGNILRFDKGKPRVDYISKYGLDNIIPTVAGLGMALNLYREASQPLSTVNTYSANPYLAAALNKLAGLRLDFYPIYQANREAEGRAMNAIAQSGGYSAAQRGQMLSNIAAQTQAANQKAMFDANQLNNLYTAQWANAAMLAGEHEAQRRQQAKARDYGILAGAHNASLQGRQMAMYNAQNALEQFFANRFKKRQFDDTMDLYRAQQDIDENALQHIIDEANKKKNSPAKSEYNKLPHAPSGLGMSLLPKMNGIPVITGAPTSALMVLNAILKRLTNKNRKPSPKIQSRNNANNTTLTTYQAPLTIAAPEAPVDYLSRVARIQSLQNQVKDRFPDSNVKTKYPTKKYLPDPYSMNSNKQAIKNFLEYARLGSKKYHEIYE